MHQMVTKYLQNTQQRSAVQWLAITQVLIYLIVSSLPKQSEKEILNSYLESDCKVYPQIGIVPSTIGFKITSMELYTAIYNKLTTGRETDLEAWMWHQRDSFEVLWRWASERIFHVSWRDDEAILHRCG